jgi:hypothetical protein
MRKCTAWTPPFYPISDLNRCVRLPVVASAARHNNLRASAAGKARLNRKPCAS